MKHFNLETATNTIRFILILIGTALTFNYLMSWFSFAVVLIMWLLGSLVTSVLDCRINPHRYDQYGIDYFSAEHIIFWPGLWVLSFWDNRVRVFGYTIIAVTSSIQYARKCYSKFLKKE